MDLNRKTAIELWNKFYGKEAKAKDYAGRMILKDSYNNDDEYGWTVDYILPKNKNGKMVESNLIVCHVTTKSEKNDNFPSFEANKKSFEIIKVENHYEIKKISKKPKNKEVDDEAVDFMDSASGIKFFKKLEEIQNKSRFVGTVFIRLQDVSNTAVIDFIEKFFDEENISYSMSKDFWESETRIIAKNYNMPLKEDISKLFDKCVTLNTYIKKYFIPMEYFDAYDIRYQVNHYKDKRDMYIESQKIGFDKINNYRIGNALFINDLVYINTEAKARNPDVDFSINTFTKYDYTYTNLSKNLSEEIIKK